MATDLGGSGYRFPRIETRYIAIRSIMRIQARGVFVLPMPTLSQRPSTLLGIARAAIPVSPFTFGVARQFAAAIVVTRVAFGAIGAVNASAVEATAAGALVLGAAPWFWAALFVVALIATLVWTYLYVKVQACIENQYNSE